MDVNQSFKLMDRTIFTLGKLEVNSSSKFGTMLLDAKCSSMWALAQTIPTAKEPHNTVPIPVIFHCLAYLYQCPLGCCSMCDSFDHRNSSTFSADDTSFCIECVDSTFAAVRFAQDTVAISLTSATNFSLAVTHQSNASSGMVIDRLAGFELSNMGYPITQQVQL